MVNFKRMTKTKNVLPSAIPPGQFMTKKWGMEKGRTWVMVKK